MKYSYDRTAAEEEGLKERKAAYNIAQDMMRDRSMAPRTRVLAKQYFDLVDKSGTETARSRAAKELAEQCSVEWQSAKLQADLLSDRTSALFVVAGVHNNLSMAE
jgi:hypothetical protein